MISALSLKSYHSTVFRFDNAQTEFTCVSAREDYSLVFAGEYNLGPPLTLGLRWNSWRLKTDLSLRKNDGFGHLQCLCWNAPPPSNSHPYDYDISNRGILATVTGRDSIPMQMYTVMRLYGSVVFCIDVHQSLLCWWIYLVGKNLCTLKSKCWISDTVFKGEGMVKIHKMPPKVGSCLIIISPCVNQKSWQESKTRKLSALTLPKTNIAGHSLYKWWFPIGISFSRELFSYVCFREYSYPPWN